MQIITLNVTELKYSYKSHLPFRVLVLLVITFFLVKDIAAQSIPIGSPVEEALRSFQLMGKTDSSISFTVRPLTNGRSLSLPGIYSLIEGDAATKYQQPLYFAGNKGQFSLLPVTITQQFNTHHPYGWNDGAMIAAKGYQALISAGIYAAIGPLKVQLQPEIVYAANPEYQDNSLYGSNSYLSYKKIFAGQSSISLSAGAFSAGVSTENLWWGPGRRSSLLMSNNATGFLHAFFRTTRPIKTPIGSFEWQVIGGKLLSDNDLAYENFNLKQANLPDDWRYFNGIVLTYHPKWVPGLFLGASRGLQRYHTDIQNSSSNIISKYLPVLSLPLQKQNAQNDDNKKADQLASIFMRWLLAKAQAEFYIEYGFNDYGVNLRDYLMSPTHASAYTVGLKKIITVADGKSRVEMNFELTQMTQSADYLVRNAGNWYIHYQVLQGYTNNNQIMGAGAGFGANVQGLTATWIKGWKQLGVLLERVERDPGYRANNWVDFSVGILPQWKYKNIVLGGKLQFINSSHYAWENENKFNLHARLMVQYLF